MKKIVFVLVAIFLYLHTIGNNKSNENQHSIDKKTNYYLGGIDLDKINIGAYFNPSTKVLSNANKYPNLSNKTFTFVNNGKRLQFHIRCKELTDIKNFQFAVVDDLKNDVLSGRVEDLHFIKHPLFGYTAELPALDINNKVIAITIYNSKDPSQQGTNIIYNKPIPKAYITYLRKEVYVDHRKGTAIEMTRDTAKFTLDHLSKGIVAVVKKNEYNFIYSVIVKEKKTGSIVFEDQSWNYTFFSSNGVQQPHIYIDKQHFQNSGEYDIIIQPVLKNLSQKELAAYSSSKTIFVEVTKAYSPKLVLIWSILLLTICGATTAIIIYTIRKRNKQKIKEEILQKNISETKLSAIQSQLNPHFLFNALSSIQGFVNDNDVDNANKYLSKFARLTRNVLESPSVNPLMDELRLLEDYLQMEQLRFGFHYNIYHKSTGTNTIEIPTMLMQPLVENAIKHGVSLLKAQGEINIYLEQLDHDLIITIKDNGKGYAVGSITQGLGISLTNDRIKLWNELHQDALISLSIQSNNTGTSVSLAFKNWL